MTLYFTPYAWAKLIHFRDKTENEVSVFGITPKNKTIVEDVALPAQTVQRAYVDIDDEGLAIMCDELAMKGLQPNQFMRIWIHTHPKGMGATPSGKDNETMEKAFGLCDWAMMMIVSQSGDVSCRLDYSTEETVMWPETKTTKSRKQQKVEVKITYNQDFPATDKAAWDKEYDEKVKEFKPVVVQTSYHYGNNGYNSYQSNDLTQVCLLEGWNPASAERAKTLTMEIIQKTSLMWGEGKTILGMAARALPRDSEGAQAHNAAIIQSLKNFVRSTNHSWPQKQQDAAEAAATLMVYFTSDQTISRKDFVDPDFTFVEKKTRKQGDEATWIVPKKEDQSLLTQMLG